jgi:hypothetical protein
MAARRKTSKKTRARALPAGRVARQSAEKTRPQELPFKEEESIADFLDNVSRLGEPIGLQDLLILGRDGTSVYWVKQQVYESSRPSEGISEFIKRRLTRDGLVLADVARSGPSTGSACILLNLAGIRRPPYFEPKPLRTKTRK